MVETTQNGGWSWRRYLFFAALIGVAAFAVTVWNRDYARKLREIERVGGTTDATWGEGDHSNPVREVKLFGPKITDAEVEHVAPHLAQFPELFTLDLSMAHVTDRGLEHLRGYNRLGDLLLRCTKVSDDGMKHLEGWDRLHTLDVMCTRITDRGVEQIVKNHPNLLALDLDQTGVTDAGVMHLKALKKLEWLALADTAVSDDCLAALSQLRGLKMLSLSGTRVRGPGLKHLAGHPQLRNLTLKRTAVNDEDVRALQAALPLARIER